MSLFKRVYGGGPGHLVTHLVALGFVLWAAVQIFEINGSLSVLKWLVAAVIVHDGILLPLYVLLDRGIQTGVVVATGDGDSRRPVRVLDHLRIPLAISAVTFIAFSPLILDKSGPALRATSTIDPSGYLGRWALFCVVVFLLSGLSYLVRVHNAGERGGT